MPIATCFINKKLPSTVKFQEIVTEWSELIQVQESDITINLITDHEQFGQNFAVMVNLYLPSLWSVAAIENIQKSLSDLLVKHLKISTNEIFIITSIVQSGHVFHADQTQHWN